MDPNANLTEQLWMAWRLTNVITTAEERERDGETLAELVIALDEWIQRGGFLPASWSSECHFCGKRSPCSSDRFGEPVCEACSSRISHDAL
jgi:hypothetical protein